MQTEKKDRVEIQEQKAVRPKKPYVAPIIVEEAVFAKLQIACTATASPPCRRVQGGS